MTDSSHRNHALVLGGSMAGLFAARVLSDHFEKVTIVERDPLPDEAEFRNGTPQARHLHQLLAAGQQEMERLFPDLKADLEAVGAPTMEWGVDNWLYGKEGKLPSVPTGIVTNTCSRVTLEFLIRRRLMERVNVTILDDHRIIKLLTNDDKSRITGVEASTQRGQVTTEIDADLIVDATGRRSKTPDWFKEIGYDAPENTYIDDHIGYATCWYEPPADASTDFTMIACLANDAIPSDYPGRSGIINRVDGDRWCVIMTGKDRDYPPAEQDEFLAFAKTLYSTKLWEMLQHATPISPVYSYRETYSKWHHYEKLNRRPENFIVTGDAACGFNPIYGQGMTMAVLDARLLNDLVDNWSGTDWTGFADLFQNELAKSLADPWLMATSADKLAENAEGDVGAGGMVEKIASAYFNQVVQAMTCEPEITRQFMKVMNMLDSPKSLMKPDIMYRVLRWKVTGKSRYPSETGEFSGAPVQVGAGD